MALRRALKTIGDKRGLDQLGRNLDNGVSFELFNRTGHGADRAARAHDAEVRRGRFFGLWSGLIGRVAGRQLVA